MLIVGVLYLRIVNLRTNSQLWTPIFLEYIYDASFLVLYLQRYCAGVKWGNEVIHTGENMYKNNTFESIG